MICGEFWRVFEKGFGEETRAVRAACTHHAMTCDACAAEVDRLVREMGPARMQAATVAMMPTALEDMQDPEFLQAARGE